MEIKKTSLKDLFIIRPNIYYDDRGYFYESWNRNQFIKEIRNVEFIQDNISFSRQNVLRGLHIQMNKPQGKLVKVNNGNIFDVAVDVRKESKTFGKWFGAELSSKNKLQLWIPKGFAHGFLVLSKKAEIMYKVDENYHPEDEVCINWNDNDIDIKWPIRNDPILSEKDKVGISLKEFKKFL